MPDEIIIVTDDVTWEMRVHTLGSYLWTFLWVGELTQSELTAKTRSLKWNREELSVYLSVHLRVFVRKQEDVETLLHAVAKRSRHLYIAKDIAESIIPAAIKMNSRTSDSHRKICLHLESEINDLDMIPYIAEVNANATSTVCGIHYTLRTGGSSLDEDEDWDRQDLNQTAASFRTFSKSGIQTTIFYSRWSAAYSDPISDYERLMLTMSDTAFCYTSFDHFQETGQGQAPIPDTIEENKLRMTEIVKVNFIEIRQCIQRARQIHANVSLGIGGTRSMVVEDWEVYLEYMRYLKKYIQEYSLQRGVVVQGNNGQFVHGWWTQKYDETRRSKVWLEKWACRIIWCGRIIVELDEYLYIRNDGRQKRASAKVTLLAEAWQWRFLRNDNGVPSFHSLFGRMALRCQSSHPVQWLIEGYMTDMYNYTYGPTTVTNDKNGDVIYHAYLWVGASRQSTPEQTSQRASLHLTCRAMDESSESPSLIIISKGHRGTTDRFFKVQKDVDENELPCAVASMLGNAYLLRNGIRMDPSQYDFLPYRGFALRKPSEGNYTCVFQDEASEDDDAGEGDNKKVVGDTEKGKRHRGLHTKTITLQNVKPSPYKNATFLVIPYRRDIYLHMDEAQHLFCGISGGELGVTIDLHIKWVSYCRNQWNQSVEVTAVFENSSIVSKTWDQNGEEYSGVRGTLCLNSASTFRQRPTELCRVVVSCFNREGTAHGKMRTIWDWQLTYRVPPIPAFDEIRNHIYCIFEPGFRFHSGTAVYSCHTAAQCFILLQSIDWEVFSGGGMHNIRSHSNFYLLNPKTYSYCPEGARCSEATYCKQTGLLSCNSGENDLGTNRDWKLWRSFLFFSSLSGKWGKPYDTNFSTNWSEHIEAWSWVGLPREELVSLFTESGSYLSGSNYTFICKAVAFHFSVEGVITITHANGTTEGTLLYPSGSNGETPVHQYVFRLTVAQSMVSIGCSVRWWNDTDGFDAKSLPMFVLARTAPKIQKSSSQRTNVILTAGIPGTVACIADVENQPPGNFTWEKITAEGPLFITHASTPGNGSFPLTFDTIDHSDEGLYRCSASNIVGRDEHYFHVSVEDDMSFAIGMSILSAIVLLMLAVLAGIGMKLYKTRKQLEGVSTADQHEFFNGTEPYDPSFEVNLSAITSGSLVGTGEFGLVFKGTCEKFPGQELAIKSIKPGSQKDRVKAMLIEIKLMTRVGMHPNLVAFVGACTSKITEGKLYILLQYCENGNLLTYLQTISTPKEKDANQDMLQNMLQWSKEIAAGMEHMHIKDIVHGDLAARNVLLDGNLTAKVSDFGLAKQLYNNAVYRRRRKVPIPWRWMAPEGLKTLDMSPATDVWSYGVTLWEIFTLGKVPYASGIWNAQHETELLEGFRLTQPPMTTSEIFRQMNKCWDYLPEHRPSFEVLKYFFLKQYTDATYVLTCCESDTAN